MPDIQQRAARIRLICTDVDGVLTDGSLHFHGELGHSKVFNVRDGAGVKFLQKAGLIVAFISGLDSPATHLRAQHLGIEDCFAGHLAKRPILDQLCEKYGFTYEQIAHVGDDLPDLPLLSRVGLACCPEDAAEEVQAGCHWVIPIPGGRGAFRAVAERILKAQGRWDEILSHYQG